MPPDGPRERFVPKIVLAPRRELASGFTASNTSGLGPTELAALNTALDRLKAAGLTERDAKLRLDGAVRV